jgi:hypothetical protein
MKYSFYSTQSIAQNIAGELVPLGNVPITFINENGASDIPVLCSVVEASEVVVQNVITGQDTVTTTNTNNTVFLIAGQKVTYNIIKTTGTWGTMTLDPSQPFASVVSTVGDTVSIQFDAAVAGVGDYSSVDYNSADYLTSGINGYVGEYTINLLEDAVEVGTFTIKIFPTVQIRQVCPDDVLNFAWLNKSGGWNSFALDCKFIQGFSNPRTKTFESAGSILKFTEIDDQYKTYGLIAESLTPFELDLLASLRTSIQAYLYNNETLQWDIPIIINTSGFETFGNKQRQPERNMSFSFRLATKEAIQTL